MYQMQIILLGFTYIFYTISDLHIMVQKRREWEKRIGTTAPQAHGCDVGEGADDEEERCGEENPAGGTRAVGGGGGGGDDGHGGWGNGGGWWRTAVPRPGAAV